MKIKFLLIILLTITTPTFSIAASDGEIKKLQKN